MSLIAVVRSGSCLLPIFVDNVPRVFNLLHKEVAFGFFQFETVLLNSWEDFSVWLIHIPYKVICSCLCSAEQNNKASLKNHNERFIFMTESRLVSEWEKFLGVSQVAVESQVATVNLWEDQQCRSIPWQATGERSFFSACRVFSDLGRFPKWARKNSSLEDDGINSLCPLVGQCEA